MATRQVRGNRKGSGEKASSVAGPSNSGDSKNSGSVPDQGDGGERVFGYADEGKDTGGIGDAPENGEQPPVERVKRKYKKRESKRDTADPKEIEGLAEILLLAHVAAAEITGAHELALTKDESASMADALQKVSSFYGDTVIPPELAAWIKLLFVTSGIYGPRYMAYRNRMQSEAVTDKPIETAFRVVDGEAKAS